MDRASPGERALLAPLITWLRTSGRVRDDTVLVEEMPWFGRRVDLATLTRTRRTTAYELKLADNRRAIEQAAYNALSFDRSYVVTGTMPSPEITQLARDHGVGVIVITSRTAGPVFMVAPSHGSVGGTVRRRLLSTLRHHGTELASV